jgi:predicted nuclease of restriction endonuclease-like RecB superfamily
LLTSDLVRATKKAGKLVPKYLADKDRARLAPIVAALVSTYRSMVGSTKGELDDAAGAIPHTARDRAVVAGLRKLCDDRVELEQNSPLEPEVVREAVFRAAARGHRSAAGFDRGAAIEEAARALECDAATIDKSLFADLRDAQVVRSFEPIAPEDLLARYDLALAQAMLLRASKITLTFEDDRPAVVRNVFRAARFHGLLHTIERASGTNGWRVTLDGPFSLFESVQKYGLRLAMFLPSAVALAKFELRADLIWGPQRTPAELVLDQKHRLVPLRETADTTRPEVESLKTAFAALSSPWEARDNDRVVVAKDGVAFVPDLVFSNQGTGEEVFLEVFGFWSRAAVWRRVEQIRAGLPSRVLLAVSKGARVSEEVLDESECGSSLYVFKTAISAKEVLRRLDEGATGGRAKGGRTMSDPKR